MNIETPKKYFYEEDKVKTSTSHNESKNSYQTVIDELLVFKIKNKETTQEDLVMYAKGLLAGRNAKNSTIEARRELKR